MDRPRRVRRVVGPPPELPSPSGPFVGAPGGDGLLCFYDNNPEIRDLGDGNNVPVSKVWERLEKDYRFMSGSRPDLRDERQPVVTGIREEYERDIENQNLRPNGGDRRSEAARTRLDAVKSGPSSGPPTGNSRARALRKLRTERDAGNAEAGRLLDEVLAERVKPNAAMIEAGFRPKRASYITTDPDAILRSLMANVSPEVLRALCDLLNKEINDD